MRNTIIIFVISLIVVSCGKDKYTSAPQIKFRSVSPNTVSSGAANGNSVYPLVTINVTDAEGDLGYDPKGKDSTKVYVKNLLIGSLDSFNLPDVSSIISKNFQADIQINTFNANMLRGSARPRPKIDTLIYEIYIKDLAKNKSNVITTDPIYFVFP